MKHFQVISLACTLFIASSCKKDKPVDLTYPDYSMLNVGNYWVYERFMVDSLGNATSLNQFDSCYIEKDTLLSGNTYFKMRYPDDFDQNVYRTNFFRDSSGYTIDYLGNIYFSATDFTSTFYSVYNIQLGNDTLYHSTAMMTDKDEVISVPAGSFITSNFKYTFQMYPNFTTNGAIRKRDNRYGKNVGCVVQTLPFFLGNPFYTEKRLKRYYVLLPD